jgi:hypothetical protein
MTTLTDLTAAQRACADACSSANAARSAAFAARDEWHRLRVAANKASAKEREAKTAAGWDDAVAAAQAEQARILAIDKPTAEEIALEADLHEALGSLSQRGDDS